MTDPNTGTFTYTPKPNVYGSDTFSFKASDGGSDSPTATITITIRPVNDPPSAAPDSVSTNEDTSVAIDYLLANDSDVDGDNFALSEFTQPLNGTVALQQQTLIYTPNPDFFGGDRFTYTIIDSNGATATAEASINVLPVNDTPFATPDSIRTPRDVSVNIPILENDYGLGDSPLNIFTVSPTTHGTASIDGSGIVRYTPENGYVGADSFTYQVSDKDGETAIADVSIEVYCPSSCDYFLFVSWTPNPESDIAGYNLYHGTTPGVYSNPIWVSGSTSYRLTTNVVGTHYFAISAVNTAGIESALSGEAVVTIP